MYNLYAKTVACLWFSKTCGLWSKQWVSEGGSEWFGKSQGMIRIIILSCKVYRLFNFQNFSK